jgi:hypothetical protein
MVFRIVFAHGQFKSWRTLHGQGRVGVTQRWWWWLWRCHSERLEKFEHATEKYVRGSICPFFV